MRCHAHHARRRRPRSAQTPVQLEREHQVGQLRLPIRAHRTVTFCRLQILEIQPPLLVRNRGEGDHARPLSLHFSRRAQERGQQQCRQRKMAQHIHPKLKLKTIRRLQPLLRRHHPGVVDQQVERHSACKLRRRKCPHRLERRQIQYHHLCVGSRVQSPHPRQGRVALALVPAPEQHMRAFVREFGCGIEADPAVGSGDQHAPAHLARNALHRPALPHCFIHCGYPTVSSFF